MDAKAWLLKTGVERRPPINEPVSGYYLQGFVHCSEIRYWRCIEIPWMILPEYTTQYTADAFMCGVLDALWQEAAVVIVRCHHSQKPVRWLTDPTTQTRNLGMIGKAAVMAWLHVAQ